MPEIIRCRGVTKIYRQGAVDVPALRGIDLDIEAGDFKDFCRARPARARPPCSA